MRIKVSDRRLALSIFLWMIVIVSVIFVFVLVVSNGSHTELTKQQEQELIRDHWDSMTPEERRKLK